MRHMGDSMSMSVSRMWHVHVHVEKTKACACACVHMQSIQQFMHMRTIMHAHVGVRADVQTRERRTSES